MKKQIPFYGLCLWLVMLFVCGCGSAAVTRVSCCYLRLKIQNGDPKQLESPFKEIVKHLFFQALHRKPFSKIGMPAHIGMMKKREAMWAV